MSVVLDQVRSHRLVLNLVCIYVFIWLFSLAGVVGVSLSENSLVHQLLSVRVSTHVYICLFI